jgi:hypothetical protein
MTPADLRADMLALNLTPRTLAKLLNLGANGERSLRRMLSGAKPIPPAFAKPLREARTGAWPKHFTPPAADPDARILDTLAGGS